MVRRAADLGMPAVAITDHGVMSGVPELCDACDAVEAETGKRVKPIYGCEVYFTVDEELRKDVKPKLYHLLLLAKTNEGYHNLLKLVSESHVDNFYYKPRTTFSMLEKYGHGIIGSSACIAGIIPKMLDDPAIRRCGRMGQEVRELLRAGRFLHRAAEPGHPHRCRVHADRAQPHADRRGQGRRPQDHRHERLPLPRSGGCAGSRHHGVHRHGIPRQPDEPHEVRERPVLHEDRRGNARGHEGLPRGLRQHR